MIFSLIAPGISFAEPNWKISQSQNAKKDLQHKVSNGLQDQLENEEKVTFLIKFKATADIRETAREARDRAEKANLSVMEQEHIQRSAVISELKSTAMESQQNVLEFLEEAEQDGIAEDVNAYHIVNGVAVTATKEVAEKLASFPEVEKLLPNEQRELIRTVDTDAELPENKTADIEWNVDRVGAPAVWDMGINGQGTVVASIDTGADWEHPALKEKYRGYDPSTGEVDHTYSFFDPVNDEEVPYDDNSHGTHVTGTMVGSEEDGSNQIGMAPGAQWISVQAFTDAGAYDTDLLDAAQWILAPGDDVTKAPDVVNNSWGGGPGLDEWYRDAVTAWRASGIFPVFAAGNTTLTNPGGPGSVAVPANYPESFAVGATDANDYLANFSLRGPSPYDEIKPDISAPGVNIRSAMPGGGYDYKNGTSMAAPAVAGVVALLRQLDANLSVQEIEQVLMDTAVERTDNEYPDAPNNGYGHGLVNVFDAVSAMVDGLGSISGNVLKEGEDNEAPTYDHQMPLEVYEDMNTTLYVQVQDNVSVLSVELEYQINDGDWQTIDASLLSGDFLDGEYFAEIAGEALEEGTLTYKWIINDFGNNEIVSETYEVPIGTGVTIGYFEDFEEEPVGWTSFGEENEWEWGVPTSGPESAASGEKVYATNLHGSYTKGANATLVMPPVELPEGEEAYLNFDVWYDFEAIHDVGYVYVSTDQEEWRSVRLLFNDSGGWENREADLSDYSGERIFIGFNITSNTPNEVTKPGMYLDNVSILEANESSSNLYHEDIPADMNMEKISDNQPETNNAIEDLQVHQIGLPLDAQVSVLETTRSTRTHPADGSYSLTSLAPGEYTVEAEAYGFYPAQKTIDIEGHETDEIHFLLEEIPERSISGTVSNAARGEGVEGARLLLMEDANITPVETDEDGEYNLTAYEGTYTMKVIARGYHYGEKEITIDEETTEINIALDPFYSYEYEEIGYDDGSGEIGRTFYDIGNRAAVKISLPEDRDQALITDGVFQFENEHLPRPGPGSTEFAVEIWDATGEDGLPGEKLAGPFEAEAIRDITEWTVIDLRDENIIVDDDFYIVYVQTRADQYSPALASDVDGDYAGRSYENITGLWRQANEIEGNYMIRARVAYEVEDPVITSPSADFITTETDISIEGTASPETTIQLLNNEEEVDSAVVDEDGTFEFQTALSEGENDYRVVSIVEGESTKQSEPVTVTLDTEAPELTIASPEDGEMTNRETATVEGTVWDANLDTVTVNGQETAVTDGAFSHRILLDEGENVIEVVATDLAGNIMEETITIYAKYTAPEIMNLTPTEDQHLETGQSVKIEFESEPGLRTSFMIHMPLTDFGMQMANATELPMMETTPGNYVGYYTVPRSTYADGAVIEVKAIDEFRNETRQQAEGRLFINLE
ncbi:S8 family serine peptidase [Virgibacillus kimchii]